MSDIFTLKSIPVTPDIGMALKNFRIENKVTAKSITEKFNRASSYISKLENGDIKKIDGDFLIQLCDFITDSNNGLFEFLNRLSQTYKGFTNESKIIIMNIDDLLCEHTIPSKLIEEIREYCLSHNISNSRLTDTINANEDIAKWDNYENLPENIWYDKNNDIDKVSIKLCVPLSYIDDLLNGKITTIHRVIAEGLLYALYRCGNEENARDIAYNKLKAYDIMPVRTRITLTEENIENIFGGLEPDAADALKNITLQLKLITTLTKEYGSKRIKQICNNMSEDIGFFFAFMSVDIAELEKKDKEKKKEFLNELKALIDKYSVEDSGIDIYE